MKWLGHHIRWLDDEIGPERLDVVIATGEGAYRRPDGIAVVPTLLGP